MEGRKSTGEGIINEFVEICRRHGLKITPQRVSIYEAILGSSNHPFAEAIYRSIRDKHPGISFDTVNRTLLTFAEIGLIDIVEASGEARRFDVNTDRHHHVRCLRCGAIEDIYFEGYDDLGIPEEVKERFAVKRVRVVIEGICRNCRSTEQGGAAAPPHGRGCGA